MRPVKHTDLEAGQFFRIMESSDDLINLGSLYLVKDKSWGPQALIITLLNFLMVGNEDCPPLQVMIPNDLYHNTPPGNLDWQLEDFDIEAGQTWEHRRNCRRIEVLDSPKLSDIWRVKHRQSDGFLGDLSLQLFLWNFQLVENEVDEGYSQGYVDGCSGLKWL